jgi:hypothetical protein
LRSPPLSARSHLFQVWSRLFGVRSCLFQVRSCQEAWPACPYKQTVIFSMKLTTQWYHTSWDVSLSGQPICSINKVPLVGNGSHLLPSFMILICQIQHDFKVWSKCSPHVHIFGWQTPRSW